MFAGFPRWLAASFILIPMIAFSTPALLRTVPIVERQVSWPSTQSMARRRAVVAV